MELSCLQALPRGSGSGSGIERCIVGQVLAGDCMRRLVYKCFGAFFCRIVTLNTVVK